MYLLFDHSAQNLTIVYETQSQYLNNSSIVCVIFDHSLYFLTIAYINLDYSLQFLYGVYSSQLSHANLDTLLSSLACHTYACVFIHIHFLERFQINAFR